MDNKLLTLATLRNIIITTALFFCSLILGACQPMPQESSSTGLCQFEEGPCKKTISGIEIALQIHPAHVPLEEELTLNFSLGSGVIVKDAHIEGINMYMGKTPIMFDSTTERDDQVEGMSFLGSCSEPRMRWQVIVTLQDQLGNERRVTFPFASQKRF